MEESNENQQKRGSMNLKEAKKTISSAQRLHENEQGLKKSQNDIMQMMGILRSLVIKMDEIQKQSANTAGAMQELNKKVEAVVSVLDSSGVVSRSVINDSLVEAKMKELSEKVSRLKEKNVISVTDGVVKETSFLVVEERSVSGDLVSPRTQFILASLGEENRNALVGTKVGDVVSLGEGKNVLTLLEVYDIVESQDSSQEQMEAIEQEEAQMEAELNQQEADQ